LRGPHETQSKPDKYPAGTRYVNLPAGSENVGTPASYAQMDLDSMMYQFYTKTDHLKAKYKPMFDELLSLPTEKSLLFHCTAGKDRTGIGAALILSALGVDRSYVIADYKATNHYWENSQMVAGMIKSGVSEARVRAMMTADPNYIKAFFTIIESRYGSVELFLKNELELDDKKLKVLKDNYLGS
jgi:protein-tyrosine phosphatase